MGRKVFVSYKYGDTSVEDLNIYEDTFWGKQKVQTKVRHYVNELSNILSNEDHIYKGEDDGQSLADFSDEYIASSLRDKIYDSSITIVIVSKGMKNTMQDEKNQWIPWEISYSLRTKNRKGIYSNPNAILIVVLPDHYGNYSYADNHNFGFEIIRLNKNNIKPLLNYGLPSDYIVSCTWRQFLSQFDTWIDRALINRRNVDRYNLRINI